MISKLGALDKLAVINNLQIVHNLSGDCFQTQDKPQCTHHGPREQESHSSGLLSPSALFGDTFLVVTLGAGV